MEKKDEDIIQTLIAGGIIGGTLIAILSKGKRENTILGALAGAAIFASVNAIENAKASTVPLLVERDGALYQLNPDGTEIFIKTISRSKRVRKNFSIK